MNSRIRSRVLSALVVLCVALLWSASPAQESHPPHWSYEGKEGPKHWGQLDPAYAACATGHGQSPINIVDSTPAELPPLSFDYKPAALSIVDNGHTIQVNYPPGSSLTVGSKSYMLKQFHFHHPSEEHINGRGFDLAAHLVHDDGSGHLAVVAVLFNTGSANQLLEVIWKNVPAQKETARDLPSVSVNPTGLLPTDRGYYTFDGSLTTPPCTEGVTWYVLKNQLTLSADQVAAFAKHYRNDARPIQPLYGRKILETK